MDLIANACYTTLAFNQQNALPHLRKTKGNIINVSSHVAKMGELCSIPYISTKVSKKGNLYNSP